MIHAPKRFRKKEEMCRTKEVRISLRLLSKLELFDKRVLNIGSNIFKFLQYCIFPALHHKTIFVFIQIINDCNYIRVVSYIEWSYDISISRLTQCDKQMLSSVPGMQSIIFWLFRKWKYWRLFKNQNVTIFSKRKILFFFEKENESFSHMKSKLKCNFFVSSCKNLSRISHRWWFVQQCKPVYEIHRVLFLVR